MKDTVRVKDLLENKMVDINVNDITMIKSEFNKDKLELHYVVNTNNVNVFYHVNSNDSIKLTKRLIKKNKHG